MRKATAYQPTQFDHVMLDILEEQLEREVGSNYERFQLEKYGDILHRNNYEEVENGAADADESARRCDHAAELQLMECDTSDIPD